jgi:small nuclear ribonucleoprotein (snRNP)-like protein
MRQPDNIKSKRTDVKISSMALNKEFLINDSIANKKYGNKVIEVSGPVGNIRNSDMHGIIITMDDAMMGMKCVLDTTIKTLPVEVKIGSTVKIKGVLIGFDPMIGLMMNQSIILESKAPAPSL